MICPLTTMWLHVLIFCLEIFFHVCQFCFLRCHNFLGAFLIVLPPKVHCNLKPFA